MLRFSDVTLRRLHRFCGELHATREPETLRAIIPAEAARLIASDRANFNEFNISKRHRLVTPIPVPAYWQQLSPVLLAHKHEHPLGDPHHTPPLHRARMFADRRNDPTWRRSALYHDYYLPAGIRHQLFVCVRQHGSVRFSLAFNRSRQGFSEEERALLQLMSSHVSLTLQRTVQSPVPSPPALTHREHEVLLWLREGKRNAEIGTILGISGRTVGKHVEHIYEKLGVETRTAAAHVLRDRGKQLDVEDTFYALRDRE